MTRDELVKGARKLCRWRRATGEHDPLLVPCDDCLGEFASGERAPTWFRRFIVWLLRG